MIKIQKVILYSLSFASAIFMSAGSRAQCPASVSLNVKNNIPANCPSTGSITIGSNSALGSLQYMITSGPSGAPINIPQSDSTFNALPAGPYVLKASCAINPLISSNISFTIINGYTPITAISTTATNSCNNNGTITVNSVTGGSLPLQYSVIQNSNPNYPDNLSVYQTTNSFTSLSPGVYVVRVKDACNAYYNSTVEILPPLPAIIPQIAPLNNQPCAANKYQMQVYAAKDATTGNFVDITPYLTNGGLTVNVYASNASCGKGALLTTFNYTQAGSPSFLVDKIASNQYYIETITSCGLVSTSCITGGTPEMDIRSTTSGCGSSATMGIVSVYDFQIRYPITVTVKNGLGNNIAGSPFTFSSSAQLNTALQNLPHDNYHITILDQCGATIDDETIPDITLAGAPFTGTISTTLDCITQPGTIGASVYINGYVANLKNVDSIKIISGPSNVGVNGEIDSRGIPIVSWDNMLPGNYVIRIYTSCGTTDINYTLSNVTTLKQRIQAMVTNYCGGTGRVEINPATKYTTYTGTGTVSYVLVNSANNARLDSNITGVFTNLGPGSYKINMKITGCTTYEIASNVVVINDAATPAAITKKLGTICEDVNGNLIATGSAYLELTGASPLVLEYKLSTDVNWTTYSTDAPSSVTINNLVPYAIYDFRLSSCTASASTQVSIGKLNPLSVSNTAQPCLNVPYALSVPPMPGATYTWKNPANVTVSSTNEYDIINYNASYDGTYTCTVKFGTCVTRIVSVNLNSVMCAQPLPIKLTSFSATNKDCRSVLSWTAVYHNTDKEFVVERSNDGQNFTAITTIPAKLANGQYSYTDVADNNSGNIYYRLKMTDLDGTYQYSNTQVVKACQDGKYNESSFTILPNPAAIGQNVNLVYTGTKVSGYYNIINTTGQTVQRSGLQTVGADAGNTINISLQGLTPGVYIVTFTTTDGKVTGHEKLVIQ